MVYLELVRGIVEERESLGDMFAVEEVVLELELSSL